MEKYFFKTFKSLKIKTNKSFANFMLINISNLKNNSKNIFKTSEIRYPFKRNGCI